MKIINVKELEGKNNVKFYYCYSIPLARFLIANNHIPVNTSVSKNKKIVYIFLKCDTLSELLKYWTENNPNKKGVENNG